MKRFLLRLGLFFIAGIILLAMVSFGHYRLLQQIVRPDHLLITPDVSVLVLGDSHPECSLNPEYMTGVENISLSSEHYLLTFYKLKALLDANPQIHTVILGYSVHNLNQFYDDFLKKEEHSQLWLNIYFPLLDEEGLDMIRAAPGYFVSSLKYQYGVPLRIDFFLLYKLVRGTLHVTDFSFWGHFREGQLSLLQDKYLRRTIEIHFYENGKVQGLSPFQMYYLFKIAEYCERRQVNLILLMTPLHEKYHKNIPPGFSRFYHQLAETLTRRYPHTHFWDFSELPLPDIFFRDPDHLNKYGAARFSTMIMKQLKNSR